ncbi:hypothetical protein [Curtobacterium sp. MCBD17_030]|uniref:hypothetical protein n=1 Tax=Curtobacterium sp. MCBD17_030 TaxID=2175649 RepID=UPI000D84BD86|nr:hypothetical protein [Curtobacterium sp. MCBD17_030]PYY32340.1 hypothetical protein DEI89_12970 [Curtobacterium sp. MCBD17_030]
MPGTYVHQLPGKFTGPNASTLPSFSPPDPFNLGTWAAAYWASDPAQAFPATGQPMTNLRDGSGNGNALAPLGSLGLPKYLSSDASMNGRPALSFDGTQVLYKALTAGVNWPWSWVAITRATALPTSGYQLFAGETAANSGQGAGLTAPTGGNPNAGYVINPNPALTGGTADLNSHLIAAVAASGTSKIQVDGSTVASGSAGTTAVNQIALGAGIIAGTPSLGNGWRGTIGFLGLYLGDVTAQPWWPSFKSWAAGYYGLSVS